MGRHRQIAQPGRPPRQIAANSAALPISASASFNSSRPWRITFMSGARRAGEPVKRWAGFSLNDTLG